MSQKGKTNQEYLCKLLENEIEYRRKTRIIKLQNSAGFPKRYAPEQFRTDEVDFPDGVSFESLSISDCCFKLSCCWCPRYRWR
jgi:hypothetical protein